MATPANSLPKPDRLNASRGQFLDGLPPRLNTLSAMVDALSGKSHTRSGQPFEPELGPLVRRLKAMRGAAETVGLQPIADAFERLVDELERRPSGGLEALERTKHGLREIGRMGQVALGHAYSISPDAGPKADAESEAPSGPVGPFTVVALTSESQRVILRQALERGNDFGLHCTQDAEEAAALLSKFDPDMFVVDGRRPDVLEVVKRAEGVPVMVVDARGSEDEYRRVGARWVTHTGEHYEERVLAALRQSRRTQSMIAPKGETAVSLEGLVQDIIGEVKSALLHHAKASGPAAQVMIEDRTQLRAIVWSMLARLRDSVSELTDGAVRYDPLTPDGTMILTGREVMRRGGRTRPAKDQLRGRRILIAEHDPSVEWYLSSLLRSKGATVLEAQDGATALSVARSKQPDLIICDVMLPGIDGFALCRNLKRDIVLSDVPIILLSWKEDLLQRVRELGAGADGYLAKEAEASVILDRCAEALQPRARIETRLREEQVVRGRLDGVTPRLVLELASASINNASVFFQDAAFQYEVSIADGRLLRACRTAATGEVESGERVLPGLLGMRAGRFVVEHATSEAPAQLYGSLQKVIEPFVARARRASRKLKGAELYAVARLEIDAVALGPYLAVSPPIVGKLVERLGNGTAPADLLQSVSAGLLESVLEDLALRGGVLRALDDAGVDVLEGSGDEFEGAFDADLETPAGTRVAAANGAPRIDARSGAAEVDAAAAFAEQANVSLRPTTRPPPNSDRGRNPVVVVGPSAPSNPEGERRSSIPPSVNRATVLGIAPEAPRPERVSSLPPLPQASLHREPSAPDVGQLSEAITPPSGTAWSLSSEPLAAALTSSPESGEVATSIPGYQSPSGPVAPRAKPEQPDVLTGGLESDGVELGQVIAAGMEATPAAASVELTGEQELSPESSAPVREPACAGSVTADPESSNLEQGSHMLQDSLRPELPTERELARGGHTLTGMGAHRDATGDECGGGAAVGQDGWKAPSVEPPARSVPPAARAPGVGPSRTAAAPSGRPAETTAEVAALAGLPTALVSRERVIRAMRKAGSVAQPALVVAAAAIAAFLGMNHLAGKFAPTEASTPALLPDVAALDNRAEGALTSEHLAQQPTPEADLDPLEVAPPGAAVAPRPSSVSVVDLPLPDDLAVAEGKGLLEVDSQGQHKLYVGNVFVGRGPVRRIPLDPGSHRVVIRLDGVETAKEVEVKPARRLRVQFAEAGP